MSLFHQNNRSMYKYFFLLVFLFFLISCGGSSFYVPVETVSQFDDRFSDTDLRMMAEKMVSSIISVPAIANSNTPSYLACGHIGNNTSEFINTGSIADKIMVALLKTGRFNIVDRKLLDEVSSELNLSASGFISHESALKFGKAVSAKYWLSGELDSIRKESRTQSLSYYKLTMQLMDIETTAIIWADEMEIKKLTKKSMIKWK